MIKLAEQDQNNGMFHSLDNQDKDGVDLSSSLIIEKGKQLSGQGTPQARERDRDHERRRDVIKIMYHCGQSGSSINPGRRD